MKDTLLCLCALLILQITTPFWWWILLVPFVYGVAFAATGWKGFRTGMLSGGLLWFFTGLYHLLTKSDIIAQRMAAMMKVNSPWFLLLITAFIAALCGGFAGGTGFHVKKVISERKRSKG